MYDKVASILHWNIIKAQIKIPKNILVFIVVQQANLILKLNEFSR